MKQNILGDQSYRKAWRLMTTQIFKNPIFFPRNESAEKKVVLGTNFPSTVSFYLLHTPLPHLLSFSISLSSYPLRTTLPSLDLILTEESEINYILVLVESQKETIQRCTKS